MCSDYMHVKFLMINKSRVFFFCILYCHKLEIDPMVTRYQLNLKYNRNGNVRRIIIKTQQTIEQ